jgi:CreA protein
MNTLHAIFSSLLAATLASASLTAHAQTIGEVDTAFQLIGSNHKIVVEAFDDPKIAGVTCHVSSAKTGGISGMLGVAQDTSDASIACRQVGPISAREPIKAQEEVFSQRRSILFKRLRVVRMVDPQRKVLLYLTYSDKLIEGSPKNSLTAVALNGAVIPLK